MALGGLCLSGCCEGDCEIILDENFEYEDGSDIGPNFDVIEGTWTISSESLFTASPSALVISSSEAATPNLYILAQVTTSKWWRLILNYVDEDNYYFAEFYPASGCGTDEQEGGWITLFTRAGGVDTALGQTFHCLGDTVTLTFCLDGTALSATDGESSIEVAVAAGTSGYYGMGTSSGWVNGQFTRVIVTTSGTGEGCEECVGDEPNGTLDPDQLPDPDETGNETYGGCEYKCIDGVPVLQGGGECTGQPGGSTVATGECPAAPAGICDDEAMDEEVFYLACDEAPPLSEDECANLDKTPAGISVTIAGASGTGINGTYELTQTASPCIYEATGIGACGGTITLQVEFDSTSALAAGGGTITMGGTETGLTAPYAAYPRVISLSGLGGDCSFSGATLTVTGATGGGGGPPAMGGCRMWACSWLSNGSGWARVDNSTFVCPSATCRCLSPPGTGVFGQLEFTQCTPIG